MGRGSSGIGGGGGGTAKTTAAPLNVPADFSPAVLSPTKVMSYARDNGLERVTDSEVLSLSPGTSVVVSNPIMNSRLANRRDPDGVSFERGTFMGLSTSAFKRPIVQLENGRRMQVDTDMPYETIYKRAGN